MNDNILTYDSDSMKDLEKKEYNETIFSYNLSPVFIETKRGHAISIAFKKCVDPLNGYLWNIDPSSGTVLVFQSHQTDLADMFIIMSDAIFSITFLNNKKPLTVDFMDAYMNLDEMI
ncbi:hypothetical protein PCANB_000058 [Pneumocystis canis]|nr:hypothetical protein PCK1_000131 [Pneumocystis canis]KAG5439776.1 hypothetical protein PCANB_000058 [Pneumocystis canis]